MATWPTWKQVAGPQLTGDELHCATLSDRDFGNGQSFVENTEARNLRELEAAEMAASAARRAGKQPKRQLPIGGAQRRP
jgi:hypothetical protein